MRFPPQQLATHNPHRMDNPIGGVYVQGQRDNVVNHHLRWQLPLSNAGSPRSSRYRFHLLHGNCMGNVLARTPRLAKSVIRPPSGSSTSIRAIFAPPALRWHIYHKKPYLPELFPLLYHRYVMLRPRPAPIPGIASTSGHWTPPSRKKAPWQRLQRWG